MKRKKYQITPDERALLARLEEGLAAGDQLTDEGRRRLEELREIAVPVEMSFTEKVLVPIGKGAMDTYQGVKQKGMQAGEMVGLVDPSSADAYTAQVNKEREYYEPFATANPKTAMAGEFIGNAASAPVPAAGGGLIPRMLLNAGSGAAIGGAQFDPTGTGQLLSNAAWGGGGAAGLDALLYGGRQLMPNRLKPQGGAMVPYPGSGQPSGGMYAGAMPPGVSSTLARETVRPPNQRMEFFNEEFKIPYTRGQDTGRLSQQQFEQRQMHGAFGEGAEQDLTQFQDFQQHQIDKGYQGMSQDIVQGPREKALAIPGSRGGRELGTEVESATRLVGGDGRLGLRSRADRLWGDVGEAFDTARKSGAHLSIEDSNSVVDKALGVLSHNDLQTPDINPATFKVRERLSTFIPQSIDGAPPVGMDATAVHTMRRLITDEMADKAVKPSDYRNLLMMRNSIDDSLLSIASTGRLIGGDKAGVAALRKGIKLRADYGRLYGEKVARMRSGKVRRDPVGRMIEAIIEDPNVGPDEVVRMVMGKGKLGSSTALSGVLKRVETIAGRGSDEYQALRNMALERLRNTVAFPPRTINGQQVVDAISPTKLRTEWQRLRNLNPGLLGQLFETKELAQIGRFVDAAGKTVYDPRSLNNSKTMHALEQAFKAGPATLGAVVGASSGAQYGVGPLGAMAGAASAQVLMSAGNTIKDILGRSFGKRIFQRVPGALPPSIGSAAAREYKEYLDEK